MGIDVIHKPKIAVDIDGCLADLESTLHMLVHKEFEIWPDSENKEFYLHNRYPGYEEKVRAFVREDCFERDNFWVGLYPFQVNIGELRKWYNSYQIEEIHILTGRKEKYREQTEKFLAKNKIQYNTLLMGVKGQKGKLVAELGYDFLIEDYHAEAVEASTHGVKTYLVKSKHNSDLYKTNVDPNIVWVNSFIKISEFEGFQ